MNIISNIIRGGQTNLHGIRMSLQILKYAINISLIVGIFCFAYKSNIHMPKYSWWQYYEYQSAKTLLSITDKNKHRIVEQLYYPIKGKAYKRRSYNILHDKKLKKIAIKFEKTAERLLFESLKISLWMFLSILLLWGLKGKISKTKKHKRGIELLSANELRLKLVSTRNASDLKLGSLPLVKDSETSHLLIAGTTGAGKSNCFNLLLSQVRKRGEKTIIYDPTGEYVAKFYRQGTDHIINPFDGRTKNWDMWSEFQEFHELEKIAYALVPPARSLDPFWVESARALFIYVVRNFQKHGKNNPRELVNFILNSDSATLRKELQNTPIAPLLDKENNKQLLSIKSTLMTHIRCFEYLEQISDSSKNFSITNWIHESTDKDDSWLFISCKPSQRELLRPLISTWIDISITALMNLSPNKDRRCWFFIDELPSLQKLPSLKTALAECRKYGGCIVAGMQSLNQMNEIYGHEESKAMLNMFNTEVYFRMIESNNREMISRALGDAEESQHQENISYGAHAVRDGVSSHSQTKITRLVTASELRHLKNLEAYIHLPTVQAITKIKMPYANIQNIKKPFKNKKVHIPEDPNNNNIIDNKDEKVLEEIPCDKENSQENDLEFSLDKE